MLPVVAAMTMGALSKQHSSAAGGPMGMLGQFFDSNQDGSVIDDVLGMASNMFNK